MSKLKVCVVIDVEGFISLKQTNPRWNSLEKFKGKINNLIKNFRYDKRGFDKIYNLIKKEKFPASFMLVGSLFKPKENFDFIDYGYHSMNHLPLTLVDDEQVKKETKNIFQASSFSPPLWMVEDIKKPDRIFKISKKQGYKIVVYKRKDDGIKCYHHNDIKPLFKKYGILCVHKSNDFTGKTSNRKMTSMIKEIKNHSGKEAVYCITTHDFVHKNLDNFKKVIYSLKKMQENSLIEIVNLAQLTKGRNK